MAARNAITMASSASLYLKSAAADTAYDTVMNDGDNNIMLIDHVLEGEMEMDVNDHNIDDNSNSSFDDDDEGYDDHSDDEDFLLYQFVQNAIEKKLIQVQNDLEELMLIQKQLRNDGGRTRDEKEEKDDGIHHQEEEEDCGVTMSMSMNVDNHKNDDGVTTESDSSGSCSNTHENNNKNELAKRDRRSNLSFTTKFTNVEYNNIHHRMNCATSSSSRRRYRHRITDGISLLDAVEKWRKMRQHYWKLFDIPVHDVSIEAGSGSSPSPQPIDSDVDGTGYYYYNYIPNPDLYVDWISSSSPDTSSNTSTAATTTSSTETKSKTKRGLFAARDFKRGEVVYSQRDNALYFQALSAWEMFLQSLRKSSSTTSSNTTDTISQHQDDNDKDGDACLAIEWAIMKRISRPGRWLVMLVLDEGVYMRRNNVAMTTPTTATTAATSTTTTNGNEVDGDSGDDDEEDVDDDDDDEWLDGNVQLYDERGLDFVALRNIRKGEEIIDAGPDVED